jgi:hypothetical protein
VPVIIRYKSFKFFFYSNEGNPKEPVHIHVRHPDGEAEFWLEPHVHLANSYGFDASTLNELTKIVEENTNLIKESWHVYFG